MITYCKNRLDVLISAGVRPILVFDGGALPMKAGTDNKRRERRDESLVKALELHKKKKYRDAEKLFIQSVHITKEMAHAYMRLL
tara:strand:+ start:183 stop:434 length:252 start_codon:yes stop_codon:yes gene_type:complete